MEKFDLLKFKYLSKIGRNEKFVEILMDNRASNNQKALSEMALDPKNERELMIAEALYTFICAMLTFSDGIAYGDMREIPLEENFGVANYIDTIKKVREGEASASECWDSLSVQDQAKAKYSFMLASNKNPNGVCRYIGEQVGVPINYLTAVDDFNELVRSLGITNTSPVDEELDINNDEQVSEFILFAKEFDKLVKEGKVHRNAERAKLAQSIRNFGRKR